MIARSLIACSILATTAVAAPPVVLDGGFDDWRQILPLLEDGEDAAGCFVDFGDVRVRHDEAYVYLYVGIGREVNLQRLDGSARLVLDVDGDPATGVETHGLAGADVVIEASARDPRRPRSAPRGFAAWSAADGLDFSRLDDQRNPYDLGWMSAPTFASARAEVGLRRGRVWEDTPPLFTDRVFRGRLVFVDEAGHECDGTDTFVYSLAGGPAFDSSPAAAPQEHDPLRRAAGTELRVMTWNVERGSLIDDPEPFVNVIRAAEPDVILLQELRSNQSANAVAAVLNRALGAGESTWHVVFAEGGGNLRCAIASRPPLAPSPTLALIDDLERPDRPVRAVGATVRHGERTLTLVSVHLTCCGRAGDERDRRRIVEARSIADALAASSLGAGLVVAGDLNAVGSGRCVRRLAQGTDLDGSDLGVADPRQIDGRSNTSWYDPGSPFGPGRLDYVLYGDAGLELLGSLVLDTSDLAADWLAHHRINADDTATASDHLPIVADFRWR